ncbi:MAG TPA: hypothetical protein VFZ25_03945 [Chloroflexota bacterium]|nr:hypothetical protein [Chloroflexota bacterium]
MLGAIERKLAAIVGDGLSGRAHLSVVSAPGGAADPPPGRGIVVVSVHLADPVPRFERDAVGVDVGGSLPRRRVLPIEFSAQLDFLQTPQAGVDTGLTDARALQLDDVSLAAHLLSDPDVRNGQAFISAAADSGYRVLQFGVGEASLIQVPPRAALTASLSCRGEAEIWPPGVASPEGIIARVDPVVEALPVRIDVADPVVRTGGTTQLKLRSLGGKRLADPATGATTPLTLAVRVISDLPPDQRGTIQSGDPGAEAGVRIITAGGAETAVTYRAPTGNLGSVRTEYVAFHLATPDKQTGVFLGSAAVSLAPAGP